MDHNRAYALAGPAIALALIVLVPDAALAQGDTTRPSAQQQVATGLLARQSDGTFRSVAFDPQSAPFGLRSNNWVGLKGPNLEGRWPGQTGANSQGFAHFDDPAYAIRAFMEIVRGYQDHNARSAADILGRYSPPGDCSGAPSVPPAERREGGGCPENEATAPVTAVRAARAVGLQPTDDLELFGPDGRMRHPDRLRALIDAVVTQEVGASHCPQPPRGESWIGCHVDDGLYARAIELLERRG